MLAQVPGPVAAQAPRIVHPLDAVSQELLQATPTSAVLLQEGSTELGEWALAGLPFTRSARNCCSPTSAVHLQGCRAVCKARTCKGTWAGTLCSFEDLKCSRPPLVHYSCYWDWGHPRYAHGINTLNLWIGQPSAAPGWPI